MLEPQSTLFFVLLVVVFIGLLWWMLVTKHLVLRILAALLAFASAMTFGIATVNKYYDYYPTWGSAWSDLTSRGVPATSVSIAGGPHTTSASLGQVLAGDLALMFLHHSVRHAQAQTRSLANRFGGVERIKDAVRIADSGAGVGKFQN